ncbi:hypothetical protein CCO03_07130 [Comamonas serinivorans]|uniref:Uncharacterized protein n=1 Tax=Comamonas serinivorans TaxID=1082851 RepID=A0A1Y0ELN0_9BURK|nr:hypothetical protein [Comamonas serinivorans]ARU04476.1 hypothetical protein CCO03_07130 [Comamonas serinivorans]
MNTLSFRLAVAAALTLSAPLLALAGPDHKHGKHRSHKETYWDGPCKVERKWKSNGTYQEKRKCEPVRARHVQPVYQEPAIVINPQIVIRP